MEFLNLRGNLWWSRAGRLLPFAAAAWLAALAPAVGRAQSPSVEFAVKATYLYKFAPFVEWPAGTFRSSADPLVLCVAGSDPVTDLVADAVKGQVVGGRAIDVVRLLPAAHDPRCHILYVALKGAAAFAVLEKLRGTPVLTVTDAASDARATGIVNFVVQDNRVRFEIDQRAAAENHLVISSKLLSLASRVSPRPG
ncbi:MAG TPA: YfiR family protein [Casimicrobiaceae bacterium]|nr:YfiR family protein [Casimicrobiaceae bacterium]